MSLFIETQRHLCFPSKTESNLCWTAYIDWKYISLACRKLVWAVNLRLYIGSLLLLLLLLLLLSSSSSSRLLVIRWRASSKSRSQQQIKAIYPSTLRMLCTVLISVTFCSSMADVWPGSTWRFWSDPSLNVPNAPVITDKSCALNFQILLMSISRSMYLLSFSVSSALTFESSGMAISISRQVFSFLSSSTVSC